MRLMAAWRQIFLKRAYRRAPILAAHFQWSTGNDRLSMRPLRSRCADRLAAFSYDSEYAGTTLLGALVLANASMLFPLIVHARPTPPPTTVARTTEARKAQSRKQWKGAFTKVAHPQDALFLATYLSLQWQQVPCVQALDHLFPPATCKLSSRIIGSVSRDVGASSYRN
jgi:hypothetical protein